MLLEAARRILHPQQLRGFHRSGVSSPRSMGAGSLMPRSSPICSRGTSLVQNSLREFSINMGEFINPTNDESTLRNQTASPSNENEDSQAEQFNEEMITVPLGVHESV
ncbi:unnamed protein product [Polarella glacialis]|uniref:Uncharacterized protein n=1 Tax=Polarella glacialis TaxID=89957 RepID=A0A813HFF5_POLGL|nr:unnamed protein product [Polarella glacialis]CAE8637065.1 unnamed protein product [Polarella glacialis]